MWLEIMLEGLNTAFYLLNVCRRSKRVSFILSKLHHGQFREPAALHFCSSETTLFFSTDLQVPWWVSEVTENTDNPVFDANMEKRPDSTNTKSQEKKKTEEGASTPRPCSGQHQNHHVHCAKKNKKQK